MTPVQAVNHIGIAVRSIEAQRPFYEGTLGAVFEGLEEVPDQKVRVGFFRIGDVRLELLEPTDPTSTVAASQGWLRSSAVPDRSGPCRPAGTSARSTPTRTWRPPTGPSSMTSAAGSP